MVSKWFIRLCRDLSGWHLSKISTSFWQHELHSFNSTWIMTGKDLSRSGGHESSVHWTPPKNLKSYGGLLRVWVSVVSIKLHLTTWNFRLLGNLMLLKKKDRSYHPCFYRCARNWAWDFFHAPWRNGWIQQERCRCSCWCQLARGTTERNQQVFGLIIIRKYLLGSHI